MTAADAAEQPMSLDSAKEEYDNLIEELIEVEEVASQMQELEESREKDKSSVTTFPVTMEIFSPVRVRQSSDAQGIMPDQNDAIKKGPWGPKTNNIQLQPSYWIGRLTNLCLYKGFCSD